MTITDTCAGFVDLRAFADSGGDHSTPVAPDPAGFGRRILQLRGGPVDVCSLHFAPGNGVAAGQPGDTFLIVVAGEIAITTCGNAYALGEGGCLVITDGAPFEWQAAQGATMIAMRYTNALGRKDGAGAVPIDPAAQLSPSGAPLAELLVGPTPSCRNHTTYLSGDGTFMAGVWASTPYHRRAMRYRHFELMYLLQGSVTFVDELGRTATFGQGDIFLVEQNAQCSWESCEDVAKIYAIYRPAA